MTKEIINNEVTINIPDDYKILNEQEIIIFTRHPAKNNFVIRNSEKHNAIDMAWSKTNIFNRHMSIKKLTSITKDTIKKANPNFHMEDDVKLTVGPFESEGFKYRYKTKAAENIGEYHLIRNNNNLYSFTFICRTDLYEENYPVFKEFLSTAKFETNI